ncbi:MAG: SH3 domain-containing protein [Rhizomicrobium sp.]|jgi:hypothetical protein
MRTAAETTQTSEGVRLDLAPLISLYGRGRRLSFRVERLPERARLTHGRNNGDRSWSLMRDDLDDLHYLPPEGMKTAHTLAIRIINLDSNDGDTLAVLDFPVTPPQSPRNGAAPSDAQLESELLRLREEYGRIKASLGLKERELAETRESLNGARSELLKHEDSLSAARRSWQADLDSKLAQARADSALKLESSRGSWQAELNVRIDEARTRWQREADAALTRAKDAWKAEETARLAQAEAQWRDNSFHALAEARAQTERAENALVRAEAEAARMSGDGAALRSLREEIAEANASLAARVRELSEARQALELARSENLRSKAEHAAARAAWQAEMDQRLTEIRTQIHANAVDDRDLEDRTQDRVDEALRQWRLDAEAALARAKEAWKSEEAVRLARAEAQWREQSARALAESAASLEKAEAELARAQAHALHESTDTIELRRVKEELTEARAHLADRETRLTQAKLEMRRARERWKSESEIALSKAYEAWKAEEAYRISVLRGDWQKDIRVVRGGDERSEVQKIRSTRRLALDGFLASAFAVGVVLAYPMATPYLAQVFPGIFSDASQRAAAAPPVSAPPQKVAMTPALPLPQDVAVHGANVRAAPSATAAIVTTIARGTKVTPLETNGSWVHIKVGDGGESENGWVYSGYLKLAAGG